MIYVAPEETVDEDGLSLRVVPQRRRSETRVEETTNLVEISGLLVRAHVIVVTTGGDVIQAAAVLWGQSCTYARAKNLDMGSTRKIFLTNRVIPRRIQLNSAYLNYNLFHEVFGALNGAAAVVVEQVEKDQQVEVAVNLK